MGVYAGIFFAAFLAATILPFYSEIAVSAAVVAGQDPIAVWAVASAGNTLGAVVNGVIGRLLGAVHAERLLRMKPETMEKTRQWFNKWGAWSLLLAWLPVGGDALTVVGGIMRVPWWLFVLLVFIGKAGRYAILIALLINAS